MIPDPQSELDREWNKAEALATAGMIPTAIGGFALLLTIRTGAPLFVRVAFGVLALVGLLLMLWGAIRMITNASVRVIRWANGRRTGR